MRPVRLSVVVLVAADLVASYAWAASPKGSRGNAIPIRVAATIPDSKGWTVRVNKSIPNATKLVLAENMFNDPPPAGRQFFLVNVTLTFRDAGKSSAFEGLTFQALGRSNVAYDYSDSCGVVPGSLDSMKDVFNGGRLTGSVCFSVKKSDAATLLLMVEPGFSFEDVLVFFKTR